MERSPSPERKKQEPIYMGTLASGQKVFDRFSSHIHESTEMSSLLNEAFAHILLSGENFVVASVDFGRTIGTSACVETSSSDEIVFAQRPRRAGLTRFVKNREQTATPLLNVILMKSPDDPQQYIVISAYTGVSAEKEPWDPFAPDEAKTFWSSHALVWNESDVMPGTATLEDRAYWDKMAPPEGAPKSFPPPHQLHVTIPAKQ